MPKPPHGTRTEVVRVRITPEEKAFLDKLSESTDRPVSSLIRMAIRGYYIQPIPK